MSDDLVGKPMLPLPTWLFAYLPPADVGEADAAARDVEARVLAVVEAALDTDLVDLLEQIAWEAAAKLADEEDT